VLEELRYFNPKSHFSGIGIGDMNDEVIDNELRSK